MDTVIAAREKLTDVMREAKLYKIMLITRERRDEMRREESGQMLAEMCFL